MKRIKSVIFIFAIISVLFCCKAERVYAASVNVPTLISAAAGENSVTLKWSTVEGADYYEISCETELNTDPMSGAVSATTTETGYTMTELEGGRIYYFRVAAVFIGEDFYGYSNSLSATPTGKYTVGEGDCGPNARWKLYSNGELTISGSGAINNYLSWSAYKNQITSVKIGEGFTEIPDNAFKSYPNLSSVSFPNSLVFIGSCSFYDCESLTSVYLPEKVAVIRDYAFAGTSLQYIKIPAATESIGAGAFAINTLEDFTVSADNQRYKSIDGVLFNGDYVLAAYPGGRMKQSYSVPNGVVNIREAAFMNSEYLEYVSFPSSVIEIHDFAFKSCHSLKAIEIPDGITYLPWDLFCDCNKLETVILPRSLTKLDNAFDGCSSLETLHFLGSQSEWNAIEKENCTFLNNAAVHFVSRSDDTISGFYEKVIYCSDCDAVFPAALQQKAPSIVSTSIKFLQKSEQFNLIYNVFDRKFVGVAVNIYDMDGNLITGQGVGYNWCSYSKLDLSIERDLGYDLIPGETYQYQFDISYADSEDDVSYGREKHVYSDLHSFIMPGTVTNLTIDNPTDVVYGTKDLTSDCIWLDFAAAEDSAYSFSATVDGASLKSEPNGWYEIRTPDLHYGATSMFADHEQKNVYLKAGDHVYICVHTMRAYTVQVSASKSDTEAYDFGVNTDFINGAISLESYKFSKQLTGRLFVAGYKSNGQMVWIKSENIGESYFNHFLFKLNDKELDFSYFKWYILSDDGGLIPLQCSLNEQYTA